MRHCHPCWFLAVLGLTLFTAADCFAQAFVERVFPPSVQRGAVTRVELIGSETQQAATLWTSLDNRYLKATQVGMSDKSRAVFDVEVAEDALLGFYGLRLATTDGLSNVHLFLIDDFPTTPESEMGSAGSGENRTRQAQPISLPATVAGVCGESDRDFYAITVAAGQTVSFEAVGSRFGKPLDPLIVIRDERGREVAAGDNSVGLFFDCRFAHTFAKAGTYTVEFRDARFHGSEHWGYVLRMGQFPAARAALPSTIPPGAQAQIALPQIGDESFAFNIAGETGRPVFLAFRRKTDDMSAWAPVVVSPLPNVMESEPNNSPQQATAAFAPVNLHGLIDARRDRDYFALDLKQGQNLLFRAVTRLLGSPADLTLALLDPDGKPLAAGDDSGVEEARFAVSVAKTGRHLLLVKDVIAKGGPEYVYRVEVSLREPSMELNCEVGRLTIPQGSWQPLPLTLKRAQFDEPVTLSLIGAPPGTTLRTTTIEKGQTELVNAILVPKGTPAGVYTLQIRAHAKSGAQEITAIAAAHPLVDRMPDGRGPHGEPFELREDQRRLPATLTDRIALFVTPPSPYDFQLPQKLVVLPRYQQTEFLIESFLSEGFDGPISFVARGGPLEYKQLQRPTVLAQIAPATREHHNISAQLSSRVNSVLSKHRVTVTGTAHHRGRNVHLTRTFELQLKLAFEPGPVPQKIEVTPGRTVTFKLAANRLSPFTGEVTITPSGPAELAVQKSITIPAGKPDVDVALKISPDIKPGKYMLQFASAARVAKFAETSGAGALEVIVKPSP